MENLKGSKTSKRRRFLYLAKEGKGRKKCKKQGPDGKKKVFESCLEKNSGKGNKPDKDLTKLRKRQRPEKGRRGPGLLHSL